MPLPLSHYLESSSKTAPVSSRDTNTLVSREQGPGRSDACRRTVHRRASVPRQPLPLHLAPYLVYGQHDEALVRTDLVEVDTHSQFERRLKIQRSSDELSALGCLGLVPGAG